MFAVTFTKGKRGSQNVLLDGFRYTKNGSHNGRTYWRCTEQTTCNARITLNEDSTLSSPLPVHVHPSQEAEIAVVQAKNSIKNAASTSNDSTKDIVATSLSTLDFEGMSKLNCNLNSLSKMSRLARKKSCTYPPAPTSLEALVIPPHYTTNSQNENILLWDSGWSAERRRSYMLGSLDNVDVLAQAPHLFIDGTFKSAPNLFTQLLSVHGYFDSGWHMPLVYGLLPGKTEVLYTNFLSQLDSLGHFEPQTILCDYEIGLHNAIRTVWPGLTIRGCFFHYKQCLWRKLQAFDLVPEYRVLGSPIRRSFKMVGAMPFVEPGSLDAFWALLKPTLPSDMDDFADYFERTWIGGSNRPPLFDTWLWNQYDGVLAGLPRSNNLIEGWHNGFQSLIGAANPSLWKFFTALKKEETLTFKKKVDWRLNRPAPPLKRKWREYSRQ